MEGSAGKRQNKRAKVRRRRRKKRKENPDTAQRWLLFRSALSVLEALGSMASLELCFCS